MRYPFALQPREPDRAAGTSTRLATARPTEDRGALEERLAARTRRPTSPPTMRRSSANAPQRAGAAQRKVAMSAPGGRVAMRGIGALPEPFTLLKKMTPSPTAGERA
jgi:hypothetical protein